MNSPTSTPRKAAIFLRISLDREMDGLAIDRQREQCEALAKYRQWQVVETYVDQSKSATDRTKVRPAYDQMVADYKAGMFNAIICYDLDRLTRQPRQLEDWIDASELHGLALVTANGDADLSTDGGRMYARIKAAVARAEMERKGARQSAAQLQRAKQGRPPKGMRPLGYAVNGDVIEHEAEVIRTIYRLFAKPDQPESLRSIARALSGGEPIAGLPHLPRHSHTVSKERAEKRIAEGKEPRAIQPDGDWSPATVLNILRNPRYAGYSTYTPKTPQKDGGWRRQWKAQIIRDDSGEPIKAQWDPIVDTETWWLVQTILDDKDRVTNTSGDTTRKHLGAGLFRCGECGQKIGAGPRGYRCAGHMTRSGGHVDEFVVDVIATRLRQPDATKRRKTAKDSPELEGINASIAEQRGKIARAQRDYDDEIIEGRDLKRVRDAAEARIAELEAERIKRAVGASLAPVLGTRHPDVEFREASLDVQRLVIDALCTVTLIKQPRGRKAFNPNSVQIEWKQYGVSHTVLP